jgi:hypothetical protein
MYYLPPEAKEIESKILAAIDEDAAKLSSEDFIKFLDEIAKECQTRLWVQQVTQKKLDSLK